MIRKILKPKTNKLVVELPKEYVNSTVELIIFKLPQTDQKKSVSEDLVQAMDSKNGPKIEIVSKKEVALKQEPQEPKIEQPTAPTQDITSLHEEVQTPEKQEFEINIEPKAPVVEEASEPHEQSVQELIKHKVEEKIKQKAEEDAKNKEETKSELKVEEEIVIPKKSPEEEKILQASKIMIEEKLQEMKPFNISEEELADEKNKLKQNVKLDFNLKADEEANEPQKISMPDLEVQSQESKETPKVEIKENIVPKQDPNVVAESVQAQIEELKEQAIKTMSILVAEDNDINQKLIRRILDYFVTDVTIVPNGAQAVEKRKNKEYDLIFMDIAMPIMDGVSATKKIKEYEDEIGVPHTPIVALTANALTGDRERFMGEGLDEYITKPVRKDTIYGILKMFAKPVSPKNISVESQQVHEESSHEENAEESEVKYEIKIPQDGASEPVETTRTVKEEIDAPAPVVQAPPVLKPKSAQIDILLFKKSVIETNILKSVLSQTAYSINSCENVKELEEKLNAVHYGVFIFDQDIPELDPLHVEELIEKSNNKHGEVTNTIMLTDNDVDEELRTKFSKVIKGVVGREELEGHISEFLKKF